MVEPKDNISKHNSGFSPKTRILMRPLERRLMFDAAAVAAIADAVLHLDAQDIDADGNTGNQPSDSDLIGTWNDDAGVDNAPDASGGNRPSYDEDAFGTGRGGVLFDGNDELTFATSAEIDDGTFNEKSFAVLFKTSNDTSGHQVIYEQGDNQRGYSISIVDGNLYAYAWNTQEWAGGDQHKVINLGTVSTDTTYNVIAVHDATGPNTWSANVNGGAFTTLNNVAAQENHSGNSAVGGTQSPTLNPTDQSVSATANFTGAVAEVYSWNHALTTQESTDVYNYLNDKWVDSSSSGGSGDGEVAPSPPPAEVSNDSTRDTPTSESNIELEESTDADVLRTILNDAGVNVDNFYAEDALSNITRTASTAEAQDAVEALSDDAQELDIDEVEESTEAQDLYDELKDTLVDSGLDLTYEEFWSLIQGLQSDTEANIIVEPSPNLSDKLSQEQSNFDNRVEDFLGSL